MIRFLRHTILACPFLFYFVAAAQNMPVNDGALATKYPFVTPVFNRINNAPGLDSFFNKLDTLKKTGNGVISIVHIGDSHIQADFLSDAVRTGLQQFFGNAGRGLVFPYQLAQSNAPDDIISSSGTRWQFNRLAHPELNNNYGVSGYGINTTSSGAGFNLSLRPSNGEEQSFKKMKFFFGDDSTTSWLLEAENNATPFMIRHDNDSIVAEEIVLDQPATSFSLASLPGNGEKEFYGVSLLNGNPGIVYHSIGVNGARYDQYNLARDFWLQLPALNADLYIISLGTNEAQRAAFNEVSFYADLRSFLEKLRLSSPQACILITTAPDSYKGRGSNRVLQQLNRSLASFCNENFIPLWDLYRATNGFGSAYSWSRRRLMNRDRIHFTAEGYRLQGNLLFNALSKGYNNFKSVSGTNKPTN